MTAFGSGEFERLLRDAENGAAMAAQMRERVAQTVGSGEAADGRIKAEITSGAGLSALHLDPRVLRLPSEELSEQVMAAVNAASKDYQSQLSELSSSFVTVPADQEGAVPDPAAAMARIEQLGNAFAGQMKDVLRELGVQQQRAQEALLRYQRPGQSR